MHASRIQSGGSAAPGPTATRTITSAGRLSPSRAAASESRSASPRIPNEVNASTRTGPLTLTEVVSAPAVKPVATSVPAERRSCGGRVIAACAATPARMTTPSAICSVSWSSRSSATAPIAIPGSAARTTARTVVGLDRARAPLGEQDEAVDRDREQDHERHRLRRRERGVGRRRDEQREPEADRALDRHPGEDRGEQEDVGGAHRPRIGRDRGGEREPPTPLDGIATVDDHTERLAAELRAELVERRRDEAAEGRAGAALEPRRPRARRRARRDPLGRRAGGGSPS